MKHRLTCGVLALCLLLTLLAGCTPKTNKYSAYSMEYFDTVTTITGYETSQEKFDAVANEVLAQLRNITCCTTSTFVMRTWRTCAPSMIWRMERTAPSR